MTAKPADINKIFASNAPATSIKDPDIASAGKYQLGWVNERPPYQTFNYAQNKVDRALSHINEYGVAEWDGETSYPIGGWARSTVDSNVYVSLIVSNQNNEPSVSSSQWISLYSAINNISSPAGSVMSFAASTPPSGWVECDGATLSRTTYADLFAAIGTIYGTGNGSTTFNLPDLRGEFVRGWDNGRGIDSGRSIGSMQSAEIDQHDHNITPYGDSSSSGISLRPGAGVYVAGSNRLIWNTLGDNAISNTGDGIGTETRPRNIAMMYCIKY